VHENSARLNAALQATYFWFPRSPRPDYERVVTTV